ncbi:hypothetical protein [Acidithiobacillus sp.]|jgi:hypothetical protein|uniref:hypothetical protein n=1 Tax=Acidithiobacillus sp. TaxID=1872118 RepID=UPI003564C6A1
MATAHLTVSIQHCSSTGVRVKFLSIQHYYFFLEHEKFQLIDYKKISSIQLFFIYTSGDYKQIPQRAYQEKLAKKPLPLSSRFTTARKVRQAAPEGIRSLWAETSDKGNH